MKLLLALLALGGVLSAAPTISTAGPCDLDVNSGEFMLAVSGSGYVDGSVVKWAGEPLATTVLSPTLLTGTVPSRLLTNSGKFSVTVTNPDTSVSGGYPCAVRPVLDRVEEGVYAVGLSSASITAHGSGFRSATAVAVDLPTGRLVFPTTFVSSTRLTATIPAQALASVGVFSVYAFDTTDGIASRPVPLHVMAPVISSLSPTSVTAGGPSFVLTVQGPHLTPNSILRWNGTPLATTYSAAASTVSATVPANLIATPGAAAITVASGAVVSNSVNLPIAAGLAPSLGQISPTSVIAGGPELTLTASGENFVAGSIMRWNATPLATTFVDSRRITARVPMSLTAQPGGADITVANPGGGLTRALGFSVRPAKPTISGINPPSAAAGTAFLPITITGTNFVAGQMSVLWNGSGIAATVTGPTQITLSLTGDLLATPGTAQIVVSILGVASDPFPFTITAARPVTTSLLPTSITAGGPALSLTVSGNYFVAESVVNWNGSPLTTTFIGATQLKAAVPAALIAAPGAASIHVANPGGLTSEGVVLQIRSPIPEIRALTPNSAVTGGASFTLAVFGVGFLPNAQVYWNGSALTTTYLSSTDLSATVPAARIASAGTAQVTVVNPGNVGSAVFNFSVAAAPVPQIVGWGPTPVAGGPSFTLSVSGANFLNGAVLQWNGTPLPTTFVTSHELRVSVAAALIATPGTATLTVVQHGMTSQAAVMTILSSTPVIVSLDPSSVAAGGPGFNLTVNGTGFGPGSIVRWNGNNLHTVLSSPSTLSSPIAAGLVAVPGQASITVDNFGSASAAVPFTISEPKPAIAALSPATVTAGGPAFALTVTGSGFLQGAIVHWNGAPLGTTYGGASTLTAQVPATMIAAAGSVPVHVANPSGSRSAATTFTVVAPNRTITAVTPSSATAGGPALTLSITGVGFAAGTVAQWNGTALPTTVQSSTQLQAVVSAALIAAPGVVNLTVGIPGAGVSDPVTFQVVPPTPLITALTPASATAGAPGFTLSVAGSNFTAAAIVRWNGAPLPTAFLDSARLTASVGGSLIANTGTALITVANGSAISGAALFTITLPAPSISGLTPSTAVSGGPGLTVTVFGNWFEPSSIARWDGENLSTVFVNATQLSARVPAALLSEPRVVNVTVASGTNISNAARFTVGAAGPSISSLTPPSATAGGPAFELTVVGAGFSATSTVEWNGTPITTVYRNETQLTATVAASWIASAGSATVTVTGASAARSLGVAFRINPPVPVVSRLEPGSVIAGSPAFVLTVSGSGFLPGAKTLWNDSPLETTFVADSQLAAAVPAGLFAEPGQASISVVNAGGVRSTAILLTVAPARFTILSLEPQAATAGSNGFQLTVLGAGFTRGAAVRWNGSPIPTHFVGPSRLEASVSAVLVAAPGEASIVVVNPNGDTTFAVAFRIHGGPPSISALRPDRMTAGAPSFILTVDGAGFLQGAAVIWDGAKLDTSFVSPTRVTAAVPADRVASAGAARVSISNPAGPEAAPVSFLVVPLAITDVNPPGAVAGSPDLPIRITGTGFLSGALVYWNGQPLPTRFGSSESLSVTVPANLLAVEGVARIVVSIPGGGLSSATEFTVRSAAAPTAPRVVSVLNPAGMLSLAPGSLISIYGEHLAAGAQVAAGLQLPTELERTTVTINGMPIPLLFVSGTQINAQAPFELAPGPARLIVANNGVAGEPFTVEVRRSAPAVFLSGNGHAFAINAADWSINSESNPARPGEFLVLYLTGAGAIAGSTTGAPPQSAIVLPPSVVQAKIGGRVAAVPFAGLIPGFVGLIQVNIEVPSGTSGEQTLEITVHGETGNSTTVSVARVTEGQAP